MDKKDGKTRTLGDGMDSSLLSISDFLSNKIDLNLNLNTNNINNSLKPIIPKGPIIKTIPKYVPSVRKKTRYLTRKPKEPKFVPYEPFKAAVVPIITKKPMVKLEGVTTKNNVDIQDLVTQMSEFRTIELSKITTTSFKNIEILSSMKQFEKEKESYETDIKNLRETNAHLENQLKFQAQVNSELKTLLVAAVGEDLETRVQHLTEDKLQLARALLSSADHLTSHQEQTEWLSGQCEVWRSKFLASSLMVEELARWKSALTNRINDLQENIKLLFDERNKVRKYSVHTFSTLHHLLDHLNQTENKKTIKSSNILDLALSNNKLAETIANIFIKDFKFDNELMKLPSNTYGENLAVKMLKNPVSFTSKPDAVCNALMGAAMSISSGQMFLQHPSAHASCCAHCKGEVYDI